MANPSMFISYSADAEESPNFHQFITELAAIAGESAFSEAKALKLPKIFATADEVILQQPDGSQEVLVTAIAERHGTYFQRFTIGE